MTMNTLKTALLGATMITAVATSALAADVYSRGSIKETPGVSYTATEPDWRGFGVAIGAGAVFGNIEVETPWFTFDGIGYDGIEVDLNAWYYAQFGQFVVGPSCGARYGNVSVEAGSTELNLDYRLYCDLHLGVAHGATLIYGLAGLSTTHVELDGGGFDDDIFGWRAGGGIKHQRDNGLVLGLEAVYTDHEDQEFGSSVSANPEDLSATLKVGFQF